MAMLKVFKFKDITDLELFLQGAVVGGSVVKGFRGLLGLTLIFTKPTAATCTFTAGATVGFHTFQEVKTKLEAAIAGLTVYQKDNQLVLRQTTPVAGGGVAISGGTARVKLGFGDSATPTGLVYAAPSGAAPRLVQAYSDANTGAHVAVVEE